MPISPNFSKYNYAAHLSAGASLSARALKHWHESRVPDPATRPLEIPGGAHMAPFTACLDLQYLTVSLNCPNWCGSGPSHTLATATGT